MNKKNFYLLLLTLCPFSCTPHTSRSAQEVFRKWFECQLVMPHKDIKTTIDQDDQTFMEALKNTYQHNSAHIRHLAPLLAKLTAHHINDHGYTLTLPVAPLLKANFANLYHLIANDMGGFVTLLKGSYLSNSDYVQREAGLSYVNNIDTHIALMQILFANHKKSDQMEHLFSVANHFFQYCFSPATFPAFERLLLEKEHYPITRMLYTTMWYNLSSDGWKFWHQASLKALQQKAAAGYRIVYIAGGSDIYQLLKAGIYNVTNIDPQLPSQPAYYTEGWEFLLKGTGAYGGVGDTITLPFETTTITMQRSAYKEIGGTFKARLSSGKTIEIPKSLTVWTIADSNGNKLGEYTIERRFCEQHDFHAQPKTQLLISFNELHFVSLPSFLNGWNIDTTRLPEDFSIIVKQLAQPVGKAILNNMHIASILSHTDFKYLSLGTSIN